MMYFCYIPCPDLETAKSMAHQAIAESLAACANIMPTMVSVFPWEGKIDECNETLLVLKTLEEHQVPLRNLIEELHPYDVPCIAYIPADQVNDSYYQWVSSHVRRI